MIPGQQQTTDSLSEQVAGEYNGVKKSDISFRTWWRAKL